MKSAPQGGAGSDDPIGLAFLGRDRPMGLSDRSDVRTSFSNAVRIDSCAALSSRTVRSSSRRSCSCRSGTTTTDTTGARAGNLAVRERRRTRLERCPAAAADPDGEGGKREAGRVRWAVGADCCGALGCRETEGLVVVVTDRGERVLCLDCAEGWLG